MKAYKKANRNTALSTSELRLPGPARAVPVAGDLALRGRRLLRLAREFAKSENYKYCWSSRGKIYVRKSEGAPKTRVNSELDLNKLKEGQLLSR